MKTTTLTRPLPLIAALLLALSFAFACGDDDGGDNGADALSGYFADVQQIFADADDATSEAEERANDAESGGTLDARLAAFDTYLGETDAIFGEATDRLQDLDAPAAAADAHQDFIDGVLDQIATLNELRIDLTDVTTDEQMESRLTEFNSGIAGGVDKADAACLALQNVADAGNVSVDLNC